MNKTGRLNGIFILVLVLIFTFRFIFLEQFLRLLNQNESLVAAEYEHLPFPLPQYSRLFGESKKNVLIGSSVFEGYISHRNYFGDDFSNNFSLYTRINEGYFQFVNELSLIRQRTGHHLIFFLQPGEFGFPFNQGLYSALVQPISNEELKAHVDLLKKFYHNKPESAHLINLFIRRMLPQYILRQSRADGFIFSVVKEVTTDYQHRRNLNKKLSKSKNKIQKYHSGLVHWNPNFKVVAQSNDVIDFNKIYLSFILDNLLKDFQVTFIELNPLNSCENDSSRLTRNNFLEAMVDLTTHVQSPGFKFISRDELPKPPDVLFADCIHLDPLNISEEKLSFLRTYFNAVFKKTAAVEFQL